jgi:aminoglycoside phosphotransferase family enzyme/predicted kinase
VRTRIGTKVSAAVPAGNDQSDVLAFLASPSTHRGAAVERIETHASVVFLAGARAWKMKRAVRYDYLDFSTLDRRLAMCEEELRRNRRTAPHLYRRIVAVTRSRDGALEIGGAGTPVEWLIEMIRFDQRALFDQLAARGALDPPLMIALAAAIARFHATADRRPDHGGAAAMKAIVDGNIDGLAEYGAGFLDPAIRDALARGWLAHLARHGPLLDRRRHDGFVRQCHGDLHLRNIVLLHGEPTLFDAIEFNDDIACCDIFYDLAFLLMDLWRHRLRAQANTLWNGYLGTADDLGGLPLLPLFLSTRAAIGAKTAATAAALQPTGLRKRELQRSAQDHLALAEQLLHPAAACVVAVGGFSASGKSTCAKAIAPLIGAVPGAVIIRSDEVRKQLCGVEPLQRLGPEGYTDAVNRRVYSAVRQRAAAVVAAGHAVIVDAVFARPSDRSDIEAVAAGAGLPFVGVWLDAPESVLVARAASRRGDASDAGARVIREQIDRGTGPLTWARIDAAGAATEVQGAARRVVLDDLRL